MDSRNSLIFEMESHDIHYDFYNNIMLCRVKSDSRKVWIKKIEGGGALVNAIEDDEMFFLAFESDEKSGQFLALQKSDGSVKWDIPGKSYLCQIYGNFLFLIFIDSEENFYLIKVRRENGSKVWHHPVRVDLCEYIIKRDSLSLKYLDGSSEEISMETGLLSE